VETHYTKHHAGYVNKLNDNLTDTNERDLPTLIKNLPAGGNFNNAAQIYNHTFYWNSMKPGGGGKATSKIAEEIEKKMGKHR